MDRTDPPVAPRPAAGPAPRPSRPWAVWLAALAPLANGASAAPGQGPAAAGEAPLERVERRLACMGTSLELAVEAPTRRIALHASEAAVRALEETEARLSTWRADSELARLNRAPLGETFEPSAELLADLRAARRGFEETGGAFDPALGALVEAFGLRRGGELPGPEARRAARVPDGFAALRFEGTAVRRTHANLVLEEGGFGKGRGLDGALRRARDAGAIRASFDLGGQVALLDAARPYAVYVRHPERNERQVLELALRGGSLATSGNGERGLVVGGVRVGHILDPRSGEPAADFGSLTVWAPDATRADMLSTGFYVLGPEEALARAAADPGIGVLVLEPDPDGQRLRARADPTFAAFVRRSEPGLELEVFVLPSDPQPQPTPRR